MLLDARGGYWPAERGKNACSAVGFRGPCRNPQRSLRISNRVPVSLFAGFTGDRNLVAKP